MSKSKNARIEDKENKIEEKIGTEIQAGKCKECGNWYDIEKNNVCPDCGNDQVTKREWVKDLEELY